MLTSPELISAARAVLRLTREELAQASKLSAKTVWKIESGRDVGTRAFSACQKALEDRGVLFFEAGERRGLSYPVPATRTSPTTVTE